MTDFGRRTGEMLKSTYDADEDGIVDNSEKLEDNTLAQVQDHTPKTHNHTESQISDLDHNALKVKGVLINDAAKADQKVLAYDSGSDRIIYITPAPSGAAINSIQYGEITITSGNLSNTGTITGVDVDKSAIFFLGNRPTDGSITTGTARVALTNATTVTAHQAAVTYDNTIRFVVLEFSSGIKSAQSDTINLSFAQTGDKTIDAVTIANSLLIHLGTLSGSSDIERAFATLSFVDTTTVRATAYPANAVLTIGFYVLEFE